jgi:hypothetical protein
VPEAELVPDDTLVAAPATDVEDDVELVLKLISLENALSAAELS